MVNFRFHLVSLTAVFLALAAGIAIGAGVVDRQTVGFLERRLEDVEENRQETIADNDALRSDLGRWEEFAEQTGDQLVAGRLAGVPVVVFALQDTDPAVVEGLRNTLLASGADFRGLVTVTERWALPDTGVVDELRAITDQAAEPRADAVRRASLQRLVSSWAAGNVAEVAAPLEEAGFLDFTPPPGVESRLIDVPLAGSRLILIGGPEASTDTTAIGVPLVEAAVDAALLVLVTQPRPADPPAEGGSAEVGLVTAVLAADAPRIGASTVDNIATYQGRIAAVLAVQELATGRTGNYGAGPGASRRVPEPVAAPAP